MQKSIEVNIPVRKLFLFAVLFLLSMTGLRSQSLFSVDHQDVSKEEFLRAYNKNNAGKKATDKSYRDYLDLYIRYKLKVRAAYDAELDTLPAQRTELQNFRGQVAEGYLKDETSMDRLVTEVYERGQKDIHLSHILIAFPKNPTPADTLRAYEKAMAAWDALKKGKKFGETALQYSEDPAVKGNGGDIGYITVFTLPYELETLAYSTAPGRYSRAYRTVGGYHIFRNDGERKSLGRIRVAQILLAYPPSATEAIREAVHHKADSIFALLRNGGDFAALARANSGDNLSYQAGGELPEFGIGRYDSVFEKAAFGLDKDGAVSPPIATAYGYHIIKRIARKPFPREWNAETAALLRQEVLSDPRIEVSRRALLDRIQQQTGFRRADYSEPDLWAFTDSSMRNIGLSTFRGMNFSTVLFTFGPQSHIIREWLDFARLAGRQRPGGAQSDKDLFNKWEERLTLDYYRNHLEDFNKEFAFQLKEFKEGNLLFEIMQRKIWDKASTDSAGLRNYYESHKDKYWWNASADVVLFTCNNARTAEDLKARLVSHPIADWRQLTDSLTAQVQADSGRYEMAQIPNPGKADLNPHSYTPFAPNSADHSVSFAYVLNIYQSPSPRNYKDARGFVINDYQSSLEDQWVAELKKKYPVKVDEKALAGLPK
jgi:peptidyl-prolyl cis-trans isomerase SurA